MTSTRQTSRHNLEVEDHRAISFALDSLSPDENVVSSVAWLLYQFIHCRPIDAASELAQGLMRYVNLNLDYVINSAEFLPLFADVRARLAGLSTAFAQQEPGGEEDDTVNEGIAFGQTLRELATKEIMLVFEHDNGEHGVEDGLLRANILGPLVVELARVDIVEVADLDKIVKRPLDNLVVVHVEYVEFVMEFLHNVRSRLKKKLGESEEGRKAIKGWLERIEQTASGERVVKHRIMLLGVAHLWHAGWRFRRTSDVGSTRTSSLAPAAGSKRPRSQSAQASSSSKPN